MPGRPSGAGRNLQLAFTPDAEVYKFDWSGDAQSGSMGFHDATLHPGRLPEPVTLVGPVDIGDPNGLVFTCEPSENAVGYELLFGSDLDRVVDYIVVSDTPGPPDGVVETIPFSKTWWTVRARDAFGSTVYADPILVNLENIPIATIRRMRGESEE